MKKSKKVYLLSFTILSLLFLSEVSKAQFTNGQEADLVLGQPDFVTSSSGVGANKLDQPYGISIHPTSGKLYVSDGRNNRILVFPAMLTSGMDAERVIGQPDFSSRSASTTASTFDYPVGTFFDSDGNFWVGEYDNKRVLLFRDIENQTSPQADIVLGQNDFTTSTSNSVGASSFGSGGLESVFIDANGRLWIGDYGFSRILWFDNPLSLSNGSAASGVIGKENFTSTNTTASSTITEGASDAYVDPNGNLWVVDYSANRVLRYNNASSLTSGAPADGVLGQVDFNSKSKSVTQSTFDGPNRVTMDSMGTLWVVSYDANRVLGFFNAATKENGALADVVLGQADFTSNDSGTSAASLNTPAQVIVDWQGRLLVVDYRNNRIIRYSHPAAQPDASIVIAKRKSKGRGRVNSTGKKQRHVFRLNSEQRAKKIIFKIKNNSTLNADAFQVSAPSFNKKSFRVTYLYKNKNITDKITNGTFFIKNIKPQATVKIVARVRTNRKNKRIRKKIKLVTKSTIDTALVDVVLAQVIKK